MHKVECRCGDEFETDAILAFKCPKCEEAARVDDERACAERSEDARRHEVDRRRKASMLPNRVVRYLKANPDHRAHSWAENATTVIAGDSAGFYIHGEVGSGKTVRAVALGMLALGDGWSVLYISESKMVHALRSSAKSRDGSGVDFVQHAIDVDLLIIDDLATLEGRTEFVTDTFSTIVLSRVDDCRPTVITSNEPPESLASVQTPAFARRVFEYFEVTN